MKEKELKRKKDIRKRKHENANKNKEKAQSDQPLQATSDELANAIVSPGTLQCLVSTSLDAADPQQGAVFTTPLQGFPTNGDSFAVLSSGIAAEASNAGGFCTTCFTEFASVTDSVSLHLTFQLPDNPGHLTFDWKFATEEAPHTFLDFFDVQINGRSIRGFPVNDYMLILEPPNPNDVCFDRITPTIHTSSVDLTFWAGQTITVTFQVADVFDCIYDTAAFIDNLQIEGCEAPIAIEDVATDMEHALAEALKACTTSPTNNVEQCLIAITNKEIVLHSLLETARSGAIHSGVLLAAVEMERALALALRACIAKNGDIIRCITLITKKEVVLQFLLETLSESSISTTSRSAAIAMERALADALRACIASDGDIEKCIDLITKKEIILQALLKPTSRQCVPRITNFSNTAPISIPKCGKATPYPSSIEVNGLTGSIIKVAVTFHRLSHTCPKDIDVMLVGPSGENTILMSDTGCCCSINHLTLTFDDDAEMTIPSPIVSGTYKPSGTGGDPFPAPAPSTSTNVTLCVFHGTNPNGTWNLYVVDDREDHCGKLTDGWELHITTCEEE